jgi:hypothetical protein
MSVWRSASCDRRLRDALTINGFADEGFFDAADCLCELVRLRCDPILTLVLIMAVAFRGQ